MVDAGPEPTYEEKESTPLGFSPFKLNTYFR